jgi:hypothetical protein
MSTGGEGYSHLAGEEERSEEDSSLGSSTPTFLNKDSMDRVVGRLNIQTPVALIQQGSEISPTVSIFNISGRPGVSGNERSSDFDYGFDYEIESNYEKENDMNVGTDIDPGIENCSSHLGSLMGSQAGDQSKVTPTTEMGDLNNMDSNLGTTVKSIKNNLNDYNNLPPHSDQTITRADGPPDGLRGVDEGFTHYLLTPMTARVSFVREDQGEFASGQKQDSSKVSKPHQSEWHTTKGGVDEIWESNDLMNDNEVVLDLQVIRDQCVAVWSQLQQAVDERLLESWKWLELSADVVAEELGLAGTRETLRWIDECDGSLMKLLSLDAEDWKQLKMGPAELAGGILAVWRPY